MCRFPVVESLDSFDFATIPKLNKMQVLELARYGTPPDFETGRELAGLFGPVDGEDPELADPLGLGDRSVRVCDRSLDLRIEIRVVGEIGDVGGLAALPGQHCDGFGVDRDQRA